MTWWICHWGILPRCYNLGLARQFTHKQMKIQVQGLFSVQCLLKYIHKYSISFFFRFSGLKKSRDLCTTVILNPVLYQKFCLCISYLVSGSTRLLPLLVILNSFEKSTSYLPSKMLLNSERSLNTLQWW